MDKTREHIEKSDHSDLEGHPEESLSQVESSSDNSSVMSDNDSQETLLQVEGSRQNEPGSISVSQSLSIPPNQADETHPQIKAVLSGSNHARGVNLNQANKSPESLGHESLGKKGSSNIQSSQRIITESNSGSNDEVDDNEVSDSEETSSVGDQHNYIINRIDSDSLGHQTRAWTVSKPLNSIEAKGIGHHQKQDEFSFKAQACEIHTQDKGLRQPRGRVNPVKQTHDHQDSLSVAATKQRSGSITRQRAEPQSQQKNVRFREEEMAKESAPRSAAKSKRNPGQDAHHPIEAQPELNDGHKQPLQAQRDMRDSKALGYEILYFDRDVFAIRVFLPNGQELEIQQNLYLQWRSQTNFPEELATSYAAIINVHLDRRSNPFTQLGQSLDRVPEEIPLSTGLTLRQQPEDLDLIYIIISRSTRDPSSFVDLLSREKLTRARFLRSEERDMLDPHLELFKHQPLHLIPSNLSLQRANFLKELNICPAFAVLSDLPSQTINRLKALQQLLRLLATLDSHICSHLTEYVSTYQLVGSELLKNIRCTKHLPLQLQDLICKAETLLQWQFKVNNLQQPFDKVVPMEQRSFIFGLIKQDFSRQHSMMKHLPSLKALKVCLQQSYSLYPSPNHPSECFHQFNPSKCGQDIARLLFSQLDDNFLNRFIASYEDPVANDRFTELQQNYVIFISKYRQIIKDPDSLFRLALDTVYLWNDRITADLAGMMASYGLSMLVHRAAQQMRLGEEIDYSSIFNEDQFRLEFRFHQREPSALSLRGVEAKLAVLIAKHTLRRLEEPDEDPGNLLDFEYEEWYQIFRYFEETGLPSNLEHPYLRRAIRYLTDEQPQKAVVVHRSDQELSQDDLGELNNEEFKSDADMAAALHEKINKQRSQHQPQKQQQQNQHQQQRGPLLRFQRGEVQHDHQIQPLNQLSRSHSPGPRGQLRQGEVNQRLLGASALNRSPSLRLQQRFNQNDEPLRQPVHNTHNQSSSRQHQQQQQQRQSQSQSPTKSTSQCQKGADKSILNKRTREMAQESRSGETQDPSPYKRRNMLDRLANYAVDQGEELERIDRLLTGTHQELEEDALLQPSGTTANEQPQSQGHDKKLKKKKQSQKKDKKDDRENKGHKK